MCAETTIQFGYDNILREFNRKRFRVQRYSTLALMKICSEYKGGKEKRHMSHYLAVMQSMWEFARISGVGTFNDLGCSEQKFGFEKFIFWGDTLRPRLVLMAGCWFLACDVFRFSYSSCFHPMTLGCCEIWLSGETLLDAIPHVVLNFSKLQLFSLAD